MMMMRRAFRAMTLFGAVAAIGCGGAPADTPDLGVVSGTVKLDGQPLGDATVSFSPESGRTSTAITDEAGEYELEYTASLKGAKIGMHSVTITTFVEAEDPDDSGTAVAEKVPTKYNKQTTLSKDVVAGDNAIDFELKSD